MSVFDARGRKLLGSPTLAEAPSGVQISPDGRRAYVTNAKANKLTVIGVAARTILSTLAIGPMASPGPCDTITDRGIAERKRYRVQSAAAHIRI